MLELKGIRKAELADQISEVQLPELFWDGREEEPRNIRAWIWRAQKWKGVFFCDRRINGEGQEACWGEVTSRKMVCWRALLFWEDGW